MMLATVGLCRSQFSAIWGTDLPVSSGDVEKGVEDTVEVVILDPWPLICHLVQTAISRKRLASPDLTS